jgi:hypothetical protein
VDTTSGGGPPSGLNTIADGFGTLHDAHAGKREITEAWGEIKRRLCAASRYLVTQRCGDHL